jgi:hypothetical protein
MQFCCKDFFLYLVVVESVFVCTTYFCVCVLGCVFGLGCFLGFLVGSWAWEKPFCMLLGSAWELLGLPSSQVELKFALCGFASLVVDRSLLLVLRSLFLKVIWD